MVEHEMNGQSALISQWIEHPCLRGLQHFVVEVMKHAPPLRGVCSDMRHSPLSRVLLLCYKSDVDTNLMQG